MKKKNEKGFSLVELLGVMVILGILISSSVIAYSRYSKKAKQQSYYIMAKSVTSSVEEYMMDNGEVSQLEISELVKENYLKQTEDLGRKEKICKENVSDEICINSDLTHLSYVPS